MGDDSKSLHIKICGLGAIIFLNVACGGFKSSRLGNIFGLEPTPSDNSQCVADMAFKQTKRHASTFTKLAKLSKKVKIETLRALHNEDLQSFFDKFWNPKLKSNPIIKKGTSLVIALDGSCGYGPVHHDITYHSVVLPYDTTENELEELASQDDCTIGVYNQADIEKFALPDDPKLSDQKHLSSINYPFSYDFYNDPDTGIKETVVVAVIDSGVDIDHPDLKDHIWTNPREKEDGVDNDCNGYVDDIYGYNFNDKVADPRPVTSNDDPEDDNGHGTHVAGLVGAISNNSIGVAGVMGKNIKIMPLNIFGASSYLQGTQNLDNAIAYATHNGAHIINLSLGSCAPTPSTKLAILNAISKGITVVVAAGNYSKTLTDTYSSSSDCFGDSSPTAFVAPAAYASEISGLISVGAIRSLTKNFASYSMSSTTHVEISAPGSDALEVGLLSTYRDGTYQRERGTSMASPLVAGAAALAYGYAKTKGKVLNPNQLETLLLKSAPSVTQLEDYIKDGKTLDLGTLRDELRDNLNNY